MSLSQADPFCKQAPGFDHTPQVSKIYDPHLWQLVELC